MENTKENNYKRILEDICNELNLEYTWLSKDWVLKLTKENVSRYICGYKFDTVEHGLGIILDDKYAMYDLLKSSGIDVVEHNIIYKESNNNDYALDCKGVNYLKDLFVKYNRNIVLKTNRGSCGVGVRHITNIDVLESNFDEMMANRHSLSVCPYYNIVNEFRAILVGGNIRLVYKKIKPIITGDGKKTIKELLVDFNENYFKDYNGDNCNDILPAGEVFEYDWKFNLSRGAISSLDVTKEEMCEIEKIVNQVKTLGNINFCSVDIIKTVDDKYIVMEINSGVMMKNFLKLHKNGYEIAKNIYKEAILCMFE